MLTQKNIGNDANEVLVFNEWKEVSETVKWQNHSFQTKESASHQIWKNTAFTRKDTWIIVDPETYREWSKGSFFEITQTHAKKKCTYVSQSFIHPNLDYIFTCFNILICIYVVSSYLSKDGSRNASFESDFFSSWAPEVWTIYVSARSEILIDKSSSYLKFW